jgi:hypothetical protein
MLYPSFTGVEQNPGELKNPCQRQGVWFFTLWTTFQPLAPLPFGFQFSACFPVCPNRASSQMCRGGFTEKILPEAAAEEKAQENKTWSEIRAKVRNPD